MGRSSRFLPRVCAVTRCWYSHGCTTDSPAVHQFWLLEVPSRLKSPHMIRRSMPPCSIIDSRSATSSKNFSLELDDGRYMLATLTRIWFTCRPTSCNSNDVGENIFLIGRADRLFVYKNARSPSIFARPVPTTRDRWTYMGWRNLMAQWHSLLHLVRCLESMTLLLVKTW